MNLTNFSLQLNGYAIARAKRKLEELKRLVNSDYEGFVHTQRAQLVAHHLKHNAFYQNLLTKKDCPWEDLPVLSKKDLQQPLQKRLSQGYTRKRVHVHKTSGSSGHPFIFAKDKFAHALTWASVKDLYASQGIQTAAKEARFYGMPHSGAAHYRERLKDLLGNRYRFSVFDTSSANFEAFIQRFTSQKFGYLNGYTSVLVMFAQYLKGTQRVLKELCPTLTHCIVTAEMLYPKDLNLLQEAFGVPIINEYGSSETGIIAMGLAQNSLAVEHRLLYVEILNSNNKPVPHGTPGKIVVTALFNEAHPFIRYELGDRGILRMEHKRPVLTSLLGREGDFAVLPNGKKIPALVFYYVTKEIITDAARVKEFVILQPTAQSLEIHYVAETAFTLREEEKINHALTQYLGEKLHICLEKKDRLNRNMRGKLRQFRRLF